MPRSSGRQLSRVARNVSLPPRFRNVIVFGEKIFTKKERRIPPPEILHFVSFIIKITTNEISYL